MPGKDEGALSDGSWHYLDPCSEILINNIDSQLRNIDSKLRNIDLQLRNNDSQLRNIDSQLRNVDSKLRNVDSKLRNIDSQLRNLFTTEKLFLHLSVRLWVSDMSSNAWFRTFSPAVLCISCVFFIYLYLYLYLYFYLYSYLNLYLYLWNKSMQSSVSKNYQITYKQLL